MVPVIVLCILWLALDIMYITVLCMLLLSGCLCISTDFSIGWFLSINLCLVWFLLICVSMCVKTAASIAYALTILYKCLSPESEPNQEKKKAFKYTAPVSWNNLQQALKLSELVTMWEWKSILKEREKALLVSVTAFNITLLLHMIHMFVFACLYWI